jgi:hypothetical protein
MRLVELLCLSQEDVIAAGGPEMDGTLATMAEAFRHWGLDDVVQAIKSTVRWGPPATENTRGRIIALAAYAGGKVDTVGAKRTVARKFASRSVALVEDSR